MLEKSGQRWKESDNVGKNRATFSVPIVRFFPTPLYDLAFQVQLIKVHGVTSDELELEKQLEDEMNKYGDFIVGNFQDKYENLTLKTLTSYTYFQVWSRVKIFDTIEGNYSDMPKKEPLPEPK